MKLAKALIVITGILVAGLAMFYISQKLISPKLTSASLCKKEESCLYGLSIADTGALELNYSNDGKYLLGRGLAGTRYWDTNNKYRSKNLGNSTAIATALDGRFAIANKDKKIKIYNETGENVLEFSVEEKTDKTIKDMAFVPGFDIIIMPVPGEERGKPLLTFWSTRTGDFISKLTHSSAIDSLEASAQGIIAVGQYNGEVVLWPLADLTKNINLTASTTSIHSMAFDKSGKLLATGSSDGEIKLWNASTGQSLKNLAQMGSMITGLAISDNGKTLASSTADGQYKLWNIESGKILEEWQYPRGIAQIALSADNKQLAIALEKNVSSSTKRVKNPKSYGPKWIEQESTDISPAVILIRDLSKLALD